MKVTFVVVVTLIGVEICKLRIYLAAVQAIVEVLMLAEAAKLTMPGADQMEGSCSRVSEAFETYYDLLTINNVGMIALIHA